mmetsp:Transcript_82306/g.172385  ORF Transcript_82306/g.172385 Transcript_82306/m.172385 type:complete len:674 (+) Transcript_82306:294-2315(+)
MSSNIVVEFEVLPDDAGQSDQSSQQVWTELQRQLADPQSQLRSGDFGRFASSAVLSAPGLSEAQPSVAGSGGGFGRTSWGEAGQGGSAFDFQAGQGGSGFDFPMAGQGQGQAGSANQGGSAFDFQGGQAGGAFDFQGQSQAQDEHFSYGHGGELAGLSNADLVDRIAHLEHQLHKVAAGSGSVPAPGGSVGQSGPWQETRGASRNPRETSEAWEEKCHSLQQRLEAVERDCREAQEAARMQRQRFEQSELKLKDREQLLVHAKEMWMKENVRASKLADALTAAEDRIADQEKRLSEALERYKEAQSEVKSLQHLVGANPDQSNGIFALDKKARLIAPESDFVIPASRGFGTANSLDFGKPDTRGIPHSAAGGLSMAGGSQQMLPMPTDGETNADRFRRLCLVNDAVLYEDELLQIGIKAEFAGIEGQLSVFFGNKGGASLGAFSVQYYVKEDRALRLTTSPLSQQLEAGKQVVQQVTAVMQEPFSEAPTLRVQFLLPDTSPRTIQCKLPVVLTKFMVGRELSTSEFFQTWRLQHFVLNEATNIIHLASRFRGALVNVARSIAFGGSLRMHHGVDSNPDNFILVGQLCDRTRLQNGGSNNNLDAERSTTYIGNSAERDRGLSLVRVEVGSGRFAGKVRIVVRSSDSLVARAVCDGIVVQLSEANAPQSDGTVAR